MSEFSIPRLSAEVLHARANQIRIVMTFEGVLHYVAPPLSLNRHSFVFDAAKADRTPCLQQITDVRMFHRFAYHGIFKPSVAEVLAQIPEQHVGETHAFEIIRRPETAADLNTELEALHAGFHVSIVRLYAL